MRKGGEPVLVENTDARIEIANPSLRKATALDTNGLPMNTEVAVQRRGGRLHVTLPPNVLYTIVSEN
jgi:MoaA/NifB/PqqE/SkfB family radical SAM enzyme